MNSLLEVLFAINPGEERGDIFNFWEFYISIFDLNTGAGDEFAFNEIVVDFPKFLVSFSFFYFLIGVVFF
jgi:hypothetical protein